MKISPKCNHAIILYKATLSIWNFPKEVACISQPQTLLTNKKKKDVCL